MVLLEKVNSHKSRKIFPRRASKRIKVTLGVKLKFLNGDELKAKSIDVSSTGLSVILDKEIVIPSVVTLILEFPININPYISKSIIVWQHTLNISQNDKQYKYGIIFEKEKTKNKSMAKFLDTVSISDEIIYDRRSPESITVSKDYNFSNSILIDSSPDTVYKIINNIDNFKNFMRDIEEIQTIKNTGNKIILKLEAMIENTNFQWIEKRECLDNEKKINVEMIDGNFYRYKGFYKVVRLGSRKSRLVVNFSITLDEAHLDDFVIKQYKRKIKKNIRLFLKAFKRQIDLKQIGLANRIIVSRRQEYENRHSERIVGYHDYMKGTDKKAPFIIVIPGYGETKRDSLITSYYFAVNGFNVFRYDASDHTGESDGEIFETTMLKLEQDIIDTIDFLENKFKVHSCGLVTNSLSARAALRAASYEKRVNFLGTLVGVVNLKDTLNSVYSEDIIGDVQKGNIKEVYEVLGFDIDKEWFPNMLQSASLNPHTCIFKSN